MGSIWISLISIGVSVTFCILFIMILVRINTVLTKLRQIEAFLKSEVNTKEEQYKERLNEEQRHFVMLQIFQVRDAVYKQQRGIHAKAIEQAPKGPPLPPEDMAQLFQQEELDIINRFWQTFHRYLALHWYDQNNRIKTVFRGAETDSTSEVGQMMIASRQLIHKLDQFIAQLHSSL
ncbi:hypothetical protein [Halalkalibacterium ligniniphilum]|uniref:hypothetical protein n=1 Tax=Halalkalibacterium ligniniphilum TaxID=1134413 RepID=UPI000376F072|nr:hypothetical protein [Halalkalibacterium ligniniphilum]